MGLFTTPSEFIAKLERLNFNKVDKDKLINSDGFTMSYSTKLQSLYGGDKETCEFHGLPVQLIFRIEKDGSYVTSWGCSDLEDTTLLAKWFVLKSNELERINHEIDRKARKEAEGLWDAI